MIFRIHHPKLGVIVKGYVNVWILTRHKLQLQGNEYINISSDPPAYRLHHMYEQRLGHRNREIVPINSFSIVHMPQKAMVN